jgi:hypothetical protein
MKIIKIGEYTRFEQLKKDVIELQKRLNEKIISLQWRDPNDIHWLNSNGYHHGPVEHEFVNLIPDLVGTEIDRMFKELPYKVFRARVMTIGPHIRYDPHTDPRPRIHIPILSNPLCKFHFFTPDEIESEYMPADGSIYWVDVRTRHTFVNDSDYKRIHIVTATDHEY